MALFDLNSRYTKSMEHGGSYERDASIGGYNRKELRGLNKQARRGTLTQRERARLKYLTDERGGRRKRGLLSGLGGAAATLGALAAAGKLGEGEGGSALMDAIKSRLAGAQEKGRERYVSRSNKQKVIEDAKRDQKALMNEAFDLESGYPSSKDDSLLSRIARRPRGLEDIDLPEEDFSDEDISIKEGLLKRLEKSPGATTVESGPALPDDLPFQERSEGGPPVRVGIAPRAVPGPMDRSDTPGSHVEQALLEMARDEASRVSSENPLPTGITSTRRNTGSEVTGLKSKSVDLGSDFPAEIPAKQATRGSNRPNVSQLFEALNRSKPSEINVDPEGIASDQYPGAAQTLLNAYNEKRRELGLEPAIQLTKEMIEETEGAMDPRDRATPQLMTRRPPSQILNTYN